MSPTRSHPGPWTEIRPGARAHRIPTSDRAHAPPHPRNFNHVNPDAALAGGVPAQIRSSASLHALAEAAVLARLEAKLGVHTAAEAVARALREST
jgi:hypothetical protein